MSATGPTSVPRGASGGTRSAASAVRAKQAVSRGRDGHEQEADRVASAVVLGGARQAGPAAASVGVRRFADGPVGRVASSISPLAQPTPTQRQRSVQPEPEFKLQLQEQEEGAQAERKPQHQEEERPQKTIQREAEEGEKPQAKVQRQSEEEGEAQTRLQRSGQAEREKEQANAQRQPEERRAPQATIDRQVGQEAPAQMRLPRKPEKTEEAQAEVQRPKQEAPRAEVQPSEQAEPGKQKPGVQRQAEERREPQAPLDRQAQQEEPAQARLQRQAEAEEPETGKAEGKDGKAAADGEAPAGEAQAVSAGGGGGPVKLHMPEPPSGPSPATLKRIGGVQGRAGGAAAAKAALPAGASQVGDARQAVDQPEAEAKAHAQADLIAMLDEKPAPSPEIVKLCERIREVIRNKRPPDEDALMEAKPEGEALDAGNQLNSSVEGETKKVQGNYGPVDNPPVGAAPAKGQELPGQPEAAAAPEVNAKAATPDPVPASNVSLDADAEASKKKMEDAGMNTPAAQLVQSGPVAEARGAQGELDQAAKEDPAKVLAGQKEALAKAEDNMAALQQQALTALTTSRATTTKGATSQQEGMVGSEESRRAKASAEAQQIFTDAQKAVTALLQPLASNAIDEWEAAKTLLVAKFKSDLAIVQDRVKERHSGVGGFFVGLWDVVTGLPDWATKAYDEAELHFSEGVIEKITRISVEVNTVIATCELLIKTARDRIAKIFSELGGGLAEWAAQEQAKFDGQLDKLHDQAIATRDNFNKDLMDRSKEAVDEVRAEISELRKKAGGLVGRIVSAINRFIEDPVKFIIEGLLELLGIPPAAFWAVVAKIKKVIKDIADDPLKFASNLLKGLSEGFGKFFDNFGTHLLKGFLSWLLGGLKDVQIPKDVSVKSIVTFFLQLMGITWPNIRKILVKLIGAKNVALIEKVYSLVSLLMEKGPEGIYEMIQEKLDPQSIVDQVVQLAVDFMVSAIIKQVTARIIALFNPVGAIVQALEAIYRVLKWIFQNAAKIFTLVETVVNGIADILAGNTGGFAGAVEKALGMLIAPVIAFIADYLSLGDLPSIVADKVKSMREWILGLIEKALTWIIEKGKALLAAIGIGKKEDKKDKKGEVDEGLGETTEFSADGDLHTLWIEKKGGAIAVLVKSKTAAVESLLSDFESKLAKETDKERKSKGQELINTARSKLGPTTEAATVESTADEKAKQEGADAGVIQESQAAGANTKASEDELAGALAAVFEFFGLDSGIAALIGKPVPADGAAPTGYTYFKDGPYKEIRKAEGAKDEYPQVYVDVDGLVQYGEPELTRYDQELIRDWENAKSTVADQFESDGAPRLDEVDKYIIEALKRKLPWQHRWGIREGLRGLIREINTGSPVVAVEKWVGRARIDWVISIIQGVNLQVLVEYKHWTAVKDADLYDRALRLMDQLEEYIRNARVGGNNYPVLIVKWPAFSRLNPRAQRVFRRSLDSIESYGATYGVAVVVELS